MLPNTLHKAFKILNLNLHNEINVQTCYKIFRELLDLDHWNKVFPEELIEFEDRAVYLSYIKWFVLRLMRTSILDKNTRPKNIVDLQDLQKKVIVFLFKCQPWHFTEVVKFLISIFRQCCNDNSKTVIQYQVDIDVSENISNIEFIVENDEDLKTILQVSLSPISSIMPLVIKVKRKEIEELRNFAFEVFRKKSISCKCISLDFFASYFDHVIEFDDKNSSFLISIFQSSTIIIRDLLVNSENQLEMKDFSKSFEFFLEKLNRSNCQIENHFELEKFVTFSREIITNLQSFETNHEFIEEKVVELIEKFLENSEISLQIVKNLTNYSKSDNPVVLSLLKYPISMEILNHGNLQQSIVEVSPTWKTFHDNFQINLESSLESSNYDLYGCLILASQIEFKTTQIYQIRQSRLTNSICHEQPVLHFFQDFEGVVKKLLNKVMSMNVPEIEILMHLIKLQEFTQLNEQTQKALLSVVVAIPFKDILQNDPIMSYLPKNYAEKLKKTTFVMEALNLMKIDVFNFLSELPKNENDQYWIEILDFVCSNNDQGWKRILKENLLKIIIHGDFITFEYFKKIFAIFDPITNLPMPQILCFKTQDKNFKVYKEMLKTGGFKYSINCPECSQYKQQYVTELFKYSAHKHPYVVVDSEKVCKKWKNFETVTIFERQINLETIMNATKILLHSQKDRDYVYNDDGQTFFSSIFNSNEATLEALKYNFGNILQIIKSKDPEKGLKCFEKCRGYIFELAMKHVYQGTESTQRLIVNFIETLAFSIDKSDLDNFAYCFLMLIYFITIEGSHVKGIASVSVFQLSKFHGIDLHSILKLYKTFILTRFSTMLMYNLTKYNISMSSSVTYLRKRLNLVPRDFLPSIIDIIIATSIPTAIKNNKIEENLHQLCNSMKTTLADQLKRNIIRIYQEVYKNTQNQPNLLKNCKKYIENKMGFNMRQCYMRSSQEHVENALVYFNQTPNFVIEVISEIIIDQNTDKIADDIDSRLLGVLISFENQLAAPFWEKSIKRHILKSIGDIIKFLGVERISKHCFRIITILNTASNECDIKGSRELCINVWEILIRISDVKTLGRILSTIFVSLECYIVDFPERVNRILCYLIEENSNLLSCNISDLFFIEKTHFDDKIKQIVMQQMHSQKVKDFANFNKSLKTLIRHLKEDNSDVKIKIYCLQYLRKLLMDNREELNKMICGQLTMEPLIEELLLILITNCKSHNENLQIALAECIGELGAIEPNLQQRIFTKKYSLPNDVLSESFAIEAMKLLCRSYQHKSESKSIDTLSLAIQKILNQHNINIHNKMESEIWMTIPSQMRPLIEPLLTSQYKPKQREVTYDIIFWNKVKSVTDWVMELTTSMIYQIIEEDKKSMLEYLLPSMKYNPLTSSFFMPYAVLHAINSSDDAASQLIKEFQFIFEIIIRENDDENMEEEESYLIIKMVDFVPITSVNQAKDDMKTVAIKVAKLIFDIFDFLENYHRTKNESNSCRDIKEILNSFDPEVLAKVNYECGEYARAMIYMEEKMRSLKLKGTSSNEFQNRLDFLSNIFAKLDNIDAVKGVLAMKTSEWPLEVRIPINNIIGNYQDAASCCARIIQLGNVNDMKNIQDIVNSYVSLNQPETALIIYENLLKNIQDKNQKICAEIQAEPLWRLSRFDELEKMLTPEITQSSSSWGVQCGEILTKFNKFDENFSNSLKNVRKSLMKDLKVSGSEQTAYEKNYRSFVNLHLISDIEKAEKIVRKIKSQKRDIKLLQNWIEERDTRFEIIQKNQQIQEPILTFHRVVLKEIQQKTSSFSNFNEFIQQEIGRLWINSIKIACKNKSYQQAQAFILNAEMYDKKDLFLEKAELYWLQGDQHAAIKTLDLGILELLKDKKDVDKMTIENKRIYSKAKMKIAQFNADAMNYEFATIKELFKEANINGAENEKIFLLTAEYLDRHYSVESDNQIAQVGKPTDMLEVMNFYFKSLLYGNDYIYQSMPRFLGIWFDSTTNSSKSNTHVIEMNKLADKAVSTFNPSYFYTAISQILSRICHPSADVYAVIKKILVKLVESHPQQVLWYLVPMLRSSNTTRKGKAKDVMCGLKSMQSHITEFNTLVNHFHQLAIADIEKQTRNLSLKSTAPDLVKFLSNTKYQFILPFEFNLQLNRAGKSFTFNNNLVYIQSIRDRVEVMSSLQRPRKVILVGSDGNEYPCLFKTQDDLRIDLRFMEVSSVLKGLLLRDPESRQRQLTTRTYSVIPINEKAGIIEWVPNLATYKGIIIQEYGKRKISQPHHSQLDKISKQPKSQQIEEYRKLIKNNFPPALSDYYRAQFATPQNFYKARLAFIKSTAAWSIIGYILGLGDRHGENILIDVGTGETFHVDCNMLFNRGEKLLVPEVVPFRMTHNMIDAMGVLGVEGTFRKSCEIILRVLQKEKNTLLAYLRPIIYDVTSKHVNEKGEGIEKEAVTSYKNVQSRLNGIATKYQSNSGIPLSVEGHVNFIIKEATSESNLAGMFRGWMPWM